MHPQLLEEIGKMKIEQLHRDAALYRVSRPLDRGGNVGGPAAASSARQVLRHDAGRPCLDC